LERIELVKHIGVIYHIATTGDGVINFNSLAFAAALKNGRCSARCRETSKRRQPERRLHEERVRFAD
jgi:hypothetical protein